ncbi:DUF5050 domain-containing protein [Paenibacillus motobuensis]|uniref:Prolow-density lipoprotein receptor-related protein 1-like beta-propeller domain-containing protein n=1 Tax=Paenibacillus motobuensis TaxID=295324 RepID=A0ABP3I218_9BACL
MIGNCSNGGLALKIGRNLLLTDIKHYSGTWIQNDTTEETKLLDGVFWFMNQAENMIVYSDQTRGNKLCSIDLGTHISQVLVDQPAYGIIVHGDWIYYLNESDNAIYRCTLNGKDKSRIADDRVESFLIDQERIYYTTQQGIRSCSLTGRDRELVSEDTAVHMLLIGNKLAYANRKNRYLLTLLNLHTGTTEQDQDISPNSLNSDGRYLYCANRSNEMTIYRIDPETGHKIRICGESADYLHIVEDRIYFCSRREWYRMSLSGGQAVKIDFPER